MCRYFIILLLFIAVLAPSYGYSVGEESTAHDSNHEKLLNKYRSELDTIQGIINKSESSGHQLYCSRQIFIETQWLLNYALDIEKGKNRIDDLKKNLKLKDQRFASEQDSTDGSWGKCYKEWFFKLDASVDPIMDLAEEGKDPKYSTKFLDRINSPKKLLTYLNSILVSDIRATGRDNRKELNYAATGLLHLLMLGLPHNYSYHPMLKKTLINYMDKKWQDPNTGYWGPWYVHDKTLIKSPGLSITFHIISYRMGEVNLWPKMIKTTLSIKNSEYPDGWLEKGRYSNHHNYDVVKILRLGWNYMTDKQKEKARAEIRKMIEWCLTRTLHEDGSFDVSDSSYVAEAYYFGVSLLEEAGFFDKRRCFWTDEEFSESKDIRKKIIKKIESIGLEDIELKEAWKKLKKGEDGTLYR